MIARLKCLFGHEYRPDRAIDRVENGATRQYAGDRPDKPIDACTIVDKCQRCGKERKSYAAVTIAEKHGLPKEWESDSQ